MINKIIFLLTNKFNSIYLVPIVNYLTILKFLMEPVFTDVIEKEKMARLNLNEGCLRKYRSCFF